MKKYIVILCSFFVLNSFAQQFITTDKFDYSDNIEWGVNGYYYKDVTGYFNQFVGTWKYQNGTTTYYLKFEKRTFTRNYPHVNKTFKEDELIGALRIIKNGTVVYDDIYTLNQNFTDVVKYNIHSVIRVENFNDCYMCTYPEQRLYLRYSEQNNDNFAYTLLGMLIHTYNDNGVTKLRLNFRSDQVNPSAFLKIGDFQSAPTKTSLFMDFGTFDFVKH
ncbi:hypothetical protein MG290_08595 [Flavobacterium sp. CBA20B-1]|uniref:DUF6705 family protein n=1 Tax=unclassified Flavobacterium TaxID=196869 RepID=UPI002223FB1F|nr:MULTISPECIES: DUF6705 family protein [unclassified Flavobacterium]WCM41017.1 hypothetical protein MG290_08595 [Flavobacterium sp. CBA20B-1]